jgi:protein ImuB
MPRLASLYFPHLATDRIRRSRSSGRRDVARHSRESGNPATFKAKEEEKLDPRFRGDDSEKPAFNLYRLNGGNLPPPALGQALAGEKPGARIADCSCPNTTGWRPGARWAKYEVGRREEPAPPPFRPSSPERGGGPRAQCVVEGALHPRGPQGPLRLGFAEPPPRAGEDQVLVTTHKVGNRMLVASACERAQAMGLTPGMPATQARALFPGLDIHDADPGGDAALLTRLALFAARRWTPRAAVSGPDGLWLDLSGVAHLFGGEERMCRRIVAFCARMGLAARIAVADTFGAAHALVRHRRDPVTLCPPGRQTETLAPLPISLLRLDEAQLATAARLGIDRIEALVAMPRGPVQRRFGSALLTRLDQALGRIAEPFDPVVPEDPPSVLLRFQEPIGSAEAIAEAMAAAMRALIADLEKKGLAARLLRLACTRVDNRDEEVAIGTARATRDGAHLLRLLLPKIETIDPGFGIERMTLVADRVEPLGAQPIDGALTGEKPPPDLVPLIDRLAGRLGPRRLYRMSAIESDVPERSVSRAAPLAQPAAWPSWPRPLRLLSPPEPVHGVLAVLPDQPPRRFTWRGRSYRVARADGPERIHGEWWRRRAEAEAVRDYFQVEDEDGRRFWLFRKGDGIDSRTGDLSWWLQGMMG